MTSINEQSSLYHAEKEAREIGLLIMYTANLEAFIIPMLSALLRCNAKSAQAITLNIDNLSAKLAIVFELAAQRPKSQKARVIRELKDPILRAVALRNKVAHSLFGVDIHYGNLSMIADANTSRRGPPKLEELHYLAIHRIVEKLREALVTIEGSIGAPPEFAELAALALASQKKRAQANQKPGKHQAAQ